MQYAIIKQDSGLGIELDILFKQVSTDIYGE